MTFNRILNHDSKTDEYTQYRYLILEVFAIFDWIIRLTPDILSACGRVIHLRYTRYFLTG